MKYCKRCVQPDTRPNIKFDEDGICGGCEYEATKTITEWDKRKKALIEICEEAKNKATGYYDCVIGVSGGKDSTFQALYAKNELGLNPLLVCNAPDGRTDVGTHNIENLRSYGFDLVEIRPDPNVMMNLTKRDFFKYGNLVKSSEYSLWSSAYRVAAEKKIPLVIQGENPALIFGLSDGVDGGNALTIKNSNTIDGCNAEDLVISKADAKKYKCEEVALNQLSMFQFPNDKELKDIKGIFLQYYVKEWGQNHNTQFARSYGLKGRYTEKLTDIGRTFRETSVDGDHLLVNQWLKYIKFGFGYETDAQCYNIRELGANREQAIKFVEMYDHCIGEQYIKAFCEYIDISMDTFAKHVAQIYNNKLFNINNNAKNASDLFIPKFKVGDGIVK